MFKTVLFRLLMCALAASSWAFAQTSPYPFGEGYFKEKLVNRGPGIGSSDTRLHAEYLGWRFDVVSGGNDEEDRRTFYGHIAGRLEDHNGLLLYPDGSPRYRIMTVGGASSENGVFIGGVQGTILQEYYHPIKPHLSGNHAIVKFVDGGSGYAGFCAGMQLMDDFGIEPIGLVDYLYPQDPGPVDSTFTGDYHSDYGDIPYVLQAGGTWVHQPERIAGLEEIATIIVPWGRHSRTLGATWFYENPNNLDEGRLLLSGVHPEMKRDQNAVAIVAEMLEATIAGNQGPVLKKELANGQPHEAYEDSFWPQWDEIKVGDGQYHHYKVTVPSGQRFLRIDLGTTDPFDLHLFLHNGDFAFLGYNTREVVGSGGSKSLVIDNPPAGEWFIGVKGASYPDANYIRNDGGIEVLNGIGYSLTATWSDAPECETQIVGATLFGNHICRGESLSYEVTAAACAAGERATLALVNSSGQVAQNLGSLTLQSGANAGSVTLSTGLREGGYSLRVTDAEGRRVASNPVTIRAMAITATTNGTRFEPNSTLRLEWQARCDFAGQTLITLRDENHREVARVLTNSSDYGLNQHDFLLNQPPGNYYFRLYAASISGDSNMFTIGEPSIENLVTTATPVAPGFPFVVNWDATAGFDGVTASLSLHYADGTLIKTLGTNLPLAEGTNTGTFSFGTGDLTRGFPSNGVLLRMRAGATTRDSGLIPVTQTPGEFLDAIPTTLYTHQLLDIRFRRNVLGDGSAWRVRYVNSEGRVITGQNLDAVNTVGEHTARLFLMFTYPNHPLIMRVEDANGNVAMESAPFELKAPTLTVYNQLKMGGMTWVWDGEANTTAVFSIYDVATGALQFEREVPQQPGVNLNTQFHGANLVEGREYRLVVGVRGRMMPVSYKEQFVY
ncbi:PPC domain-containing protein [Acanthopleuribacter pedis]|uniref:PPC domain-containing protein n=1 Tax=Acanthopleuribacter pedis TaxID=442870 RepID=A0A8J7Q148_9BACT|nr:PPC domain-containing protein [Acanthopleuribacter pedis]MBO1317214.1 PPC domain-containing protein [Acanthopleuribacter pedis]MBO1318520.1 PPC domain-containing protein [Acanthopleuribacter pedis]